MCRRLPLDALEGFLQVSGATLPFHGFESNAEESVEFYLRIFKKSRRLDELGSDGSRAPKRRFLTIAFELDGQGVTAINGMWLSIRGRCKRC